MHSVRHGGVFEDLADYATEATQSKPGDVQVNDLDEVAVRVAEKRPVRLTGAQALPKGVLLLRIIAHRHRQSSKCSFSCRWSVTRLGVTPPLTPIAPFSRRFRRAGLRVR